LDEALPSRGRNRSGRINRGDGCRVGEGRPQTAHVDQVEALARESWRAVTGAWVVEAAALVSPDAPLGCLALHHRKPEQAPSPDWRGMTERASRGYWHRPIGELRVEARAELAAEAHAHRMGLPLEEARAEVEEREPARLLEVRRLGGHSDVLEPLGTPRGPPERHAAA
jgi:hypothetical protein